MFLALRDLRCATGRFGLMGAVVALITVLLVMLSGLTAGLGNQNTAALDRLQDQGVQRLVYSGVAGQDPSVSFTQSEFPDAARQAWADTEGVAEVNPLGISQSRAVGVAGALQADQSGVVDLAQLDTTGVATAAFLGIDPDGPDAAALGSANGGAALAPGKAALSRGVAEDLGVAVGDSIVVAAVPVQVGSIVEDEFYSHSPVIWLATDDWRAISHTADPAVLGTVGLVRFAEGADAEATADRADAAAHTTSASVRDSYAALPSYSSENGSLMTMQGFLYGISALVVIAFLSIWTVQRTREIAVLKALGGSTGWVLRDALIQSGIVLALGVLVGTGAAIGLGAIAAGIVPFSLSLTTTLLPALGVLGLGMLGAGLAVARVTRIDPLVALGGN
ncbi:MAG: ABC transporter permease [Micrococcus sp.]|nr:ABC transporter permease [Micrococcus sp.]